MKLYLIRHGQSLVNLKEYADTNFDAGLTPLGADQAARLAAWMPAHVPHLDKLFASTMQRARETVAPLAQAYDVPVSFDDRIREIGNNRLDHTPWPAEDLPQFADFWGSERPFSSMTPGREGGESLSHFRSRVGMFIEELVETSIGMVVAAVCHGGVIETAFDLIFNVGIWRRSEVWTFNTGISLFEYVDHPKREAWRLHFHSRIEHLPD